jgi:hypothetical protein
MNAVLIASPLATMAWPAFHAAVATAAGLLGYRMAFRGRGPLAMSAAARPGQQLSVMREGVTVTFSRDVRGKVHLCVTGNGRNNESLQALGHEINQAVVQQYICKKLKEDMAARGFDVVEEAVSVDRSICLKVRRGED